MTLNFRLNRIGKIIAKIIFSILFCLTAYYVMLNSKAIKDQMVNISGAEAVKIQYNEFHVLNKPGQNYLEIRFNYKPDNPKIIYFNWKIYSDEYNQRQDLKVVSVEMTLVDDIEAVTQTFYASNSGLALIGKDSDINFLDPNDQLLAELFKHSSNFLNRAGNLSDIDKEIIKKMCKRGLDAFKKIQ